MRKQNDLDKILMIIALKQKHGDSVVHCVDKVIAFNTFYASRNFTFYVAQKFMLVTQRSTDASVNESVLALDIKTGKVVIDTLGFFGPVKTIGDLESQQLQGRAL